MTNDPTSESIPRKPLRLWPGVVAAVLLVLARFFVPLVVPESMFVGLLGYALGTIAILVWWLLFSRAPWSERLGAVVLTIVALFVTSRLVHVSIAGGAMGFLLYFWAVPILCVALVGWAAASRSLANGPRRAALVATILLGCGVWTLVRTDGTTSDVIGSDFHWRWTPTHEERLLAQSGGEPTVPSPPARAESVKADPPKPETPEEPPASKAADKPAARSGGSSHRADRTGCPGSDGRACRVAGLSRIRARQHHPRRADRHQLVPVAAGRDVAPADRTGLVVLRGSRRPPLHAGAAG